MNNLKFDNELLIHTVGAFLKPVKVIDSENKEYWLWCVSEFTDDSFLNGEVYNPKEFALSKRELLNVGQDK
ncbi:MAG TPA: hypothetical protein PLE30_02205 [Candidatus Kapabacteria bacterium]|nr:hypothetical protein [Candidatus Kapabacteria bacterium]